MAIPTTVRFPYRCGTVELHCVYTVILTRLMGKLGFLSCGTVSECHKYCSSMGEIWYPLFASADAGIYPHLTSQYHAWPSAARGIAMLRVGKFSYPRQQTRGN